MYNEDFINKIFEILNLKPDEHFTIILPSLNNTAIVKDAYISERLYLVDVESGCSRDDYLLHILRGIFCIVKHS